MIYFLVRITPKLGTVNLIEMNLSKNILNGKFKYLMKKK